MTHVLRFVGGLVWLFGRSSHADSVVLSDLTQRHQEPRKADGSPSGSLNE